MNRTKRDDAHLLEDDQCVPRTVRALPNKRRASVYLILDGLSVDDVREKMDALPFVIEGLMTLEYEEIYQI